MADYRAYTAETLFDLLNRGDEAAFGELYERYWGRMYLHALKMLQDRDAAKDVVQEGFIHLWEIRGRLQVAGHVDAYLYKLVQHRVLNHIRNQRVRTGYTDLFGQYLERHSNHTLETIQEKELLQAVQAIVQSLPDRMREIFELSRGEDLSHKEIADRLGIAPATVKRQVSNALNILKDRLDKPEVLILAVLLFRDM